MCYNEGRCLFVCLNVSVSIFMHIVNIDLDYSPYSWFHHYVYVYGVDGGVTSYFYFLAYMDFLTVLY